MEQVVRPQLFTSDSGRRANEIRWAKQRALQSVDHHRARVREYLESQGRDAASGDPLLFWSDVLSDPEAPLDYKLVAARESAPYLLGPPPKEPAETERETSGQMHAARADLVAKLGEILEENARLKQGLQTLDPADLHKGGPQLEAEDIEPESVE